ncbi:hypothetical protein VNI00_016773 [Paramarasmius palmivorus]|uniref:Uncharacterized protein n=1 Tax=Paramarasmius palmivorus TaxID=297713 RepID=A0AAW0BAY3_9AGAR
MAHLFQPSTDFPRLSLRRVGEVTERFLCACTDHSLALPPSLMPPVFLRARHKRQVTPSSHARLSPQDVHIPLPSEEGLHTEPSGQDLSRRSSSPALSVASSTASDESLVTYLWNKIHKNRVIVQVEDGWRFEYRDDETGNDSIPTPDLEKTAPSHNDADISGTSVSPGLVTGLFAAGTHTTPQDNAATRSSASPVSVNVGVQPNARRKGSQGRKISKTPEKATRVDRAITSADKRREAERLRKARARSQNKEEMKAKQAVFAARYRAKNRDKLKEKARLSREKSKG